MIRYVNDKKFAMEEISKRLVSFVNPKTGEYGIGIRDKINQDDKCKQAADETLKNLNSLFD